MPHASDCPMSWDGYDTCECAQVNAHAGAPVTDAQLVEYRIGGAL